MQSSKAINSRGSGSSNSNMIGMFSGVKYQHLLAGVSGGVTSTLLLHPLDLLKVRFAVPDSGGSSNGAAAAVQRPHYNGIGNATAIIWKTEGFRGFYKGVTPNLVGGGASWGLYFLFYNMLKTKAQEDQQRTQLGRGSLMSSAAQAGVLTLLLCNPIWVVKTRLCLQYDNVTSSNSSSVRYSGMLDALAKTYKHEGVKGLYKGLVPGLFGVSHGALQFTAYEELKVAYNVRFNRPVDARLTTLEYLSCAAVSKLFAVVTTYPYQVLRARMQDQHAEYKNLRECVRYTWRHHGAMGFYRGLLPNLMRVVPATGITFIVYENVFHALMKESDGTQKEKNNGGGGGGGDDAG